MALSNVEKSTLFTIFQGDDDESTSEKNLEATPKHAWENLQKSFCVEKVKKVQLQVLPAEFKNIKMNTSQNIREYVTCSKIVKNEMESNIENLDDVLGMKKRLCSLTRTLIMLLHQSRSQKIHLRIRLISL